jgi:hypothetical protein
MLQGGTGLPSSDRVACGYQSPSESGESVRSSNHAQEYSTLSASYVPLPSLLDVFTRLVFFFFLWSRRLRFVVPAKPLRKDFSFVKDSFIDCNPPGIDGLSLILLS